MADEIICNITMPRQTMDICNNCNTSYVDNIKILPIQRQAGTLANGCVQPSMVSQDFLSNILLNAINTCGIQAYLGVDGFLVFFYIGSLRFSGCERY